MSSISFSLILAGVLLNAFAQLALKAGTNAIGVVTLQSGEIFSLITKCISQPFILLGLGLYVVSVAIWIGALSRVPVSVAYPMLSIGYIVNALLAFYFFNESLSASKFAGIVIIIIGVYILAKG